MSRKERKNLEPILKKYTQQKVGIRKINFTPSYVGGTLVIFTRKNERHTWGYSRRLGEFFRII